MATTVGVLAALCVGIILIFSEMAPGMPELPDSLLVGPLVVVFGISFVAVFREMLQKFTR